MSTPRLVVAACLVGPSLLVPAATPASGAIARHQTMGPADDEGMVAFEIAAPPPTLSPSDLQFFESTIRPILVDHCYKCHSAKSTKLRGGLRLDTREATLAGGSSGSAVVPGDIEASLLITAVRYLDDDLAMPPDDKLPAEAIAALEEWVRRGAPDPRVEELGTVAGAGPATYERTIDIEKGKQFWAFQLPVRHAAPAVSDESWPLGEVDRFILAALDNRGLQPVGEASRSAWLRRVTFDLTGLPPTPEAIAAFEKDRSPAAHEKVVDGLLASPAFGERWGRHWLDVARYGESSGKENNVLYPHAWRYRDYVIAAFNEDKPYDLFLSEQLAGDLLPAEDPDDRAEKLVATAYLALGAKSHNTQNRSQFAYDLADEQIDAFSQGMLGLTAACARCHDHKFDPIPQQDYYALAGIFLSSSTHYGTLPGPGNRRASSLIQLPDDASALDGPAMAQGRRTLLGQGRARLENEVEAAAPAKPGDANAVRRRQQSAQLKIIDSILDRFDAQGEPTDRNRVTMGMSEGTRPIDAPLLQRGEVDKPAGKVARGFVQVLCADEPPSIPPHSSGRLELAAWVASERNPLTARVWANRVWLHLFGRGLVPTPDNFGASGQLPSHPELLDTLAVRFMIDGEWSTKKLIRELVLSRTYRLSSAYDKALEEADPENAWLGRMPKRRLEAEAIRDAMLAAAGALRTEPPVGSPVNFAEGAIRGDNRLLQGLLEQDSPVRSVYLPIVRDRVPGALDVFDFPDPAFVIGNRDETNVATQALFLMNSPEAMSCADAFADRLLATGESRREDDSERIARAFVLALGRKPSGQEILASRGFLADFQKASKSDAQSGANRNGSQGKSSESDRRPGRRVRERLEQRSAAGAAAKSGTVSGERAAWSAFCQSLFQTSEFRTLD